jgi:hypothetical protein
MPTSGMDQPARVSARLKNSAPQRETRAFANCRDKRRAANKAAKLARKRNR